jgi:hypothetical protein
MTRDRQNQKPSNKLQLGRIGLSIVKIVIDEEGGISAPSDRHTIGGDSDLPVPSRDRPVRHVPHQSDHYPLRGEANNAPAMPFVLSSNDVNHTPNNEADISRGLIQHYQSIMVYAFPWDALCFPKEHFSLADLQIGEARLAFFGEIDRPNIDEKSAIRTPYDRHTIAVAAINAKTL